MFELIMVKFVAGLGSVQLLKFGKIYFVAVNGDYTGQFDNFNDAEVAFKYIGGWN